MLAPENRLLNNLYGSVCGTLGVLAERQLVYVLYGRQPTLRSALFTPWVARSFAIS
jgi:hypothetical protein